MQLFFDPQIDHETEQFTIAPEESRHLTRVLRKKTGDLLFFTNGKGWEFTAQVKSVHQKKCIALIIDKQRHNPSKRKIHLAVAPTKMNDRYEWFLEKATEIGVQSITPIICTHSERKTLRVERLEKILQAAMKQSVQYFLPKLNGTIPFSEFVRGDHSGQKFIAHCMETDRKSLMEQISAHDDVLIMIGPEGDFSPEEINVALDNGFIPVTLGQTRLRTETAALVACHTAVLKQEDR